MVAGQRVSELRDRDPALRRSFSHALTVELARSMAAATSRTARIASLNIENTSGWRSSSVSTISPKGVLWTVRTIRAAWPSGLAAVARACSSATGFRFCGMMLLHCTKPSRQPQIAHLARAPQQQVLHHPAETGRERRRRRHALQQVVDRGDAAVGVPGRRVEAKEHGGSLAIDREPGAGDRAGAERIAVGAGVRGAQSDAIALELFDDRHQVVRDRGQLRRLGVRVGGKDVLAVTPGQVEQDGAQLSGPVDERENPLPLAHAVHRHVDVVARAGGVQPPGGVLAAGRDDQPSR